MDKEAVDTIVELALDAHDARILKEHIPALVVGEKIVSLEHLKENRARFRGTFTTSVLSEFVSYLKANSGGAAFIDPKQMRAEAFLNLGTTEKPGHADWRATLALEPTAAYAALRAIEGRPMSQRDLAEWIEDWAANMKADGESGEIPIASAVMAIREITVEGKKAVTTSDRDFGASRSALEQIEANAKGTLPKRLRFDAVPYIDFQNRTIPLRLAVITGDKPMLTLRIIGKESMEEAIAQEFKLMLKTQIGGNASVTLGKFTP